MTPEPRRSFSLARSIASLSVIALLLLSGCAYTTTTVAGQELHTGAAEAGEIHLRSAEHRDVTVDKHSDLRFRRRDGSLTVWVGSRQLHVNDEGVFALHGVPLSEAIGARVEGLTAGAGSLLAETAPAGTPPRSIALGTFELDASGDELVAWLDRFILAVARHLPAEMQDPPPWCYGRNVSGFDCANLPADRDARANRALRYQLGGAPLGRWSFDLLSGRTGPFQGKALFAARSEGVLTLDGLRWDDLVEVEVKNLSPGKTAANVAVDATTSVLLAAVMLPVAVAGTAGRALGNGVPRHASTPVALDGVLAGSGAAAREEDSGSTLWARGLRLPNPTAARPLLGSRATSRRAF